MPSIVDQMITGADLAFFQGGVWPIVHEPRSGEPIFFLAILRAAKRRADFFGDFTSREAASRFFFLAILRAAKRRADFFGYFTSREAASRFFVAILNPRKWCFPGIY